MKMLSAKIDRNNRKPLYLQVYETIREYILSPDARNVELLPSTNELAGIFEVGHNTVRQALRMLVDENLICRIKHRGTILTANQNPRDPQVNNYAIGLVFPSGNIESNIWREVIHAMRDECQRQGSFLDIYFYDWHNLEEEKAAIMRARRHCSGLILYPNAMGNDFELIQDLKKGSYPFLLFCLYFEDIDCNIVANNNFHAGRELTALLFARGCERVAFIADHMNLQTMASRYEGYQKACDEAGKKLYPEMVLSYQDVQDTDKLIGKFLQKHKPDGIICGTSTQLGIARRMAGQQKLNVMLYGTFHLEGTKLENGNLLTAAIQSNELGHAAVEVLNHQIRNRHSVPRKLFLNMKIEG